MDAARCRRCGRPFTSGEIVGLGILRPRAAEKGGPVVEYACPGCRAVNTLVPHGLGRFAPPGEPAPPRPADEDLRVPWQRERQDPPERPPAQAPEPAAAGPTASRSTGTRAGDPGDGVPAPADDALPTTASEAFELLGLPVHASREAIAEAFRVLALRLHPDKVAHLDAELVSLAERKFRRAQAARDLLLGD